MYLTVNNKDTCRTNFVVFQSSDAYLVIQKELHDWFRNRMFWNQYEQVVLIIASSQVFFHKFLDNSCVRFEEAIPIFGLVELISMY